MQCFNPRSRMGSDVREECNQAWENVGFNPRSRMGSDNIAMLRSMMHIVMVSIHAPAWGATSADHWHLFKKYIVSIHAPAWGATQSMC